MTALENANIAEHGSGGFQALLAAVGQAVIVLDPRGAITFWNPAAETMYGWSAAEALGRNAGELIVSAESLAHGQEIMDALLAGQSWHGEFDVQRRNGESFPVLVTDAPVFNERGDLVAVIGLSTDITERKRVEEAARTLSAIVESTADSILTKDLDGTILTWNRAAEELYGYQAADVIGRHVRLLDPLDPLDGTDHARTVLATVAGGETVREFETVRRRRDGSKVEVSLTVSPIFGEDSTVAAASEIGRDIGDRRQLEATLTRQAMHDTLTGLPNRALLADRLSHALAGSARRGLPVALLFLDLDKFKAVNDVYGHLVGDQVLMQVASRLSSVIRPADTCARFGGDEFVIVCEDTDETGAMRTAERLHDVLTGPIEAGDRRHTVSACIGIAVTPPLNADPDTLLRCADAAMYSAKVRGRSQAVVFDPLSAPQDRKHEPTA